MKRSVELRENWKLVLAGAVGFGFGLSGLPFYTSSVFVEPLSKAFGWTVAMIQGGLTVSYLTTVVAMPVVGALVDRVGARRVAILSISLFGTAFCLLGLQDGRYWLYCLNWGLIALAGTGTLSVTWSRVINAAFNTDRGLALGMALLGSGVMGVVGPLAAGRLIEAFGWRVAYGVLGLSPLVVALPVIAVLMRGPSASQVIAATPAAPERRQGRTLREALRTPQFWLLSVSVGLLAGGVAGLIPNLVKIEISAGLSLRTATASASLVGLFVIVGRTACGALMDRFWAPGVAALFVACPAFACLLLASPHVPPSAAIAAAALIGLAGGADMDLLPYLVSRYFGLARFGAILGAGGAFFYLGASVGGVLLGAVYDELGRFAPGLLVCAAMFSLAIAGLLLLGPYPAPRAVDRTGDRCP